MAQKLRQDSVHLGDNLRRLRKAAGYTQEQVAAKLQLYGLPTSRSIYSRMETGEYNIRVAELVALKLIFGVDYAAFFAGLEEQLHASQ